jgi:hypothetical protein
MDEWKLISIVWNAQGFVLTVSPWFCAVVIGLVGLAWLGLRGLRRGVLGSYHVVEAQVDLGRIGHLKLKPTTQDIQIAHRIWTELVTRKAAIPIDPEQDVITEVYDSWYTLFGRIRDLIAEIPAELIRRHDSTKLLVWTATQTLNEGLRPHLTRWQADFRNWMKQHEVDLKDKSPQGVQKTFPQYQVLIADMRRVNEGLIQYAQALEKIARG